MNHCAAAAANVCCKRSLDSVLLILSTPNPGWQCVVMGKTSPLPARHTAAAIRTSQGAAEGFGSMLASCADAVAMDPGLEVARHRTQYQSLKSSSRPQQLIASNEHEFL